MKMIEIDSHQTSPTEGLVGMTGLLAYPAMPDADTCDGTCVTPVDPIIPPVDESSCNEDDMEYNIEGTCRTVEICGQRDVVDEDSGRTTSILEVCFPRCTDPLTIWNATSETCELIIPPITCEDSLIPHIERE
jgi:hypothetical protein